MLDSSLALDTKCEAFGFFSEILAFWVKAARSKTLITAGQGAVAARADGASVTLSHSSRHGVTLKCTLGF